MIRKRFGIELIYKILTIILILTFFAFVYLFIMINSRYDGKSEIKNNYYDVEFINSSIDITTTSTISTDSQSDEILIKITDLNKFVNGNSYNVELYNIGNLDAEVNNIVIYNINTNIRDENQMIISTSITEGDVIKASEKKMININIKCNDKQITSDSYYEFTVRFSYKEVEK